MPPEFQPSSESRKNEAESESFSELSFADSHAFAFKRFSTIDCHRSSTNGSESPSLSLTSEFGLNFDFLSKNKSSTKSSERPESPKTSEPGSWLESLKQWLSGDCTPRQIDANEPLPRLIINGKEESYPQSKRYSFEDDYDKTKIADPYQWLESTDRAETKDWVKKQTELTERFLQSIPERQELHKRLEKIYDYEQRSQMWKQGGKYYFWKQDGLKEQPELCVIDSLNGKPRTILDANTLSKDGHGIVRDLRLSDDGKYAEFRFADGGQDRTRYMYYDLAAKREIAKLPESVRTRNISKDTIAEAPGEKPLEFMLTSKGTDRNKLVLIDRASGKQKDILPESEDLLLEAQIIGNKILAHYLKDAASELKLFELDGKLIKKIELPGRGTVKAINGTANDSEFFFTYSDFTTPNTIFRGDAESGKIEAHFVPEPKFNPDDFETEEKFCKSKDGSPVHLFIVHKKGLKLDGENPVYLHGYGGFRINRSPIFDNGNIAWLQDGGVLAVANLRGGLEYGESFHKAGMKDRKQNVFDDFIASAEFLIEQKYTDKSKLAIGGRSNGGLLVGATLVQRPDLFKAAIPEVGLFDMLRFPKLGPGRAWEPEYGYPSNPEDFKTLLKYSPLQNLKRGSELPAVLTMTNINDDRVLPSHSFKFIAEAQRAQAKKENPVLLYLGQGCGHGPEKYTTQLVDEYANKWAFLKNAMRDRKTKGN